MNQKKISIHAYKFDSKLYRAYEFPTIIDETDEYVCVSTTLSKVIYVRDGKNVYSKINRPTIWFFLKNELFDVIYSLRFGKIYCYINITGPFLIENDTLKYIDFDIDYRTKDITDNDEWELLDVDEYEVNKIEMNYPEKIQEKIIETKEKIMQLIKEGYFINHFAKYINELKEEEKGSNGN